MEATQLAEKQSNVEYFDLLEDNEDIDEINAHLYFMMTHYWNSLHHSQARGAFCEVVYLHAQISLPV